VKHDSQLRGFLLAVLGFLLYFLEFTLSSRPSLQLASSTVPAIAQLGVLALKPMKYVKLHRLASITRLNNDKRMIVCFILSLRIAGDRVIVWSHAIQHYCWL